MSNSGDEKTTVGKPSFLSRFKRQKGERTTFASEEATQVGGGSSMGSGGNIGGGPVRKLSKKGPLLISRPTFEPYYIYGLMALLGYMTADLTILNYRDKFLPEGAPASFARPPKPAPYISIAEYDAITNRNIFNSDGVIPDALQPAGGGPKGQQNQEGPAIPTTLTQLVLIGTLVHANPARSVATIQVKGTPEKVLPYFPNDDIENLGQLVKVERKKAIFRNRLSGRLEYIEIKDDSVITFGRSKNTPKQGEIMSEGNNFSLNRGDLNGYLKNLDQILQQATAVPNVGPSGQIEGFRLVDIQPGSVYEKLGLKKNDVIREVNGQAVDSPNKALELYNSLKNSSNISIAIDRNGAKENLNFNVVE